MRWISENKLVSGIILATIVLLTLLAFSTGERAKANWGTDGVQIVLRPFQQFFTWSANGIGGFFMHFGDIEKAQGEIKSLTEKLAKAEEEAREIQNFRQENEDLRALLSLESTLKGETVAANVIAKDFSNWYSSFTIDKGAKDGVQDKKAVRTTSGLVGYISEVGTNWAKVTTILNDNTNVSGVVTRTNEAVMCQGEFGLQKDGRCRLNYISSDANIVPGDVIQTSGLGGIYPKGISIGIVGDISATKQSVSQTAILVPSVDFEKVSIVLVEL